MPVLSRGAKALSDQQAGDASSDARALKRGGSLSANAGWTWPALSANGGCDVGRVFRVFCRTTGASDEAPRQGPRR
jgi:hypothetical protein